MADLFWPQTCGVSRHQKRLILEIRRALDRVKGSDPKGTFLSPDSVTTTVRSLDQRSVIRELAPWSSNFPRISLCYIRACSGVYDAGALFLDKNAGSVQKCKVDPLSRRTAKSKMDDITPHSVAAARVGSSRDRSYTLRITQCVR